MGLVKKLYVKIAYSMRMEVVDFSAKAAGKARFWRISGEKNKKKSLAVCWKLFLSGQASWSDDLAENRSSRSRTA